MRLKRSIPATCVAVFCAVGCSPAGGDPDAGATPDAGDIADAGGTPDAGGAPLGGPITFEVSVPGGSFEPNLLDQDGHPYSLSVVKLFPADSLAESAAYAGAGVSGDSGHGPTAGHLKSTHVFVDGDTDGGRVEYVAAGFLRIVEGVTYELRARLYNPGSGNWYGAGPTVGFVVGAESRRTDLSIADFPEGEWKDAALTYVGSAGDAGKMLGMLVGVHGNGGQAKVPELWVDGLRIAVTTAHSLAIPNADFASPAVSGQTTTLPDGWTLGNDPWPGVNTAGLVHPPGADFKEAEDTQYLRLDNAKESVEGHADYTLAVQGPVIGAAEQGRTYFFSAVFRDFGSMQWAGSGPTMALKVGDEVVSGYADAVGMKSWGNAAYRAVFAYTVDAAHAGRPLAVRLETYGVAAGPNKPFTYVTGLAMGVQ